MSDGIYVALSGALGRQRQLETVANDLANLETPGYRSLRPSFREYLGTALGSPGQAPDAVWDAPREVPADRVLLSIEPGTESKRPGPLRETRGELDLALEDAGYFVLQTAQGVRYTRDGRFQRDAEGFLAAGDGSRVLGEKGPLHLPAGTVQVLADGTLRARGQDVGRLLRVELPPQALQREGANRYRCDLPGRPVETPVRQGWLEGADVSALSGMVQMIALQRSFSALQQVIQSYREIDQRANEAARKEV
ncbi:MAG: flagellar hook-basal body protein [Myxococcales bacterium]|nr:flagellar hook-basal body protein [Myxococcales bacterium]